MFRLLALIQASESSLFAVKSLVNELRTDYPASSFRKRSMVLAISLKRLSAIHLFAGCQDYGVDFFGYVFDVLALVCQVENRH